MRNVFTGIGLLLVLAFLLPALGADDPKDRKDKNTTSKKTTSTKPSDKEKKTTTKEKALKAGEPFVGKLTQVEGAQRYLTVQVTYKSTQENPQAAVNMANLRRQLIGNRDPNSIANIRLEMAKNQQNLYKDQTKNLELAAGDDMKVRTMLPPVEYDDKGKVKKLTPKELKALKGPDQNVPGFPADFDNLKPGQTVRVYVTKPKKDLARGKPKDKDLLADSKEKPKVMMIVILAEPAK